MPSLPPPMWAELHYAGTWNPLSMREPAGFTATRGRSGERDSAGPSAGTMTLLNTNSMFSRRNPGSPLFGEVGLFTPIRYGYDAGSVWAETTGAVSSYLSTPSSAAFDLAGDLDLRAEIAPDVWDTGVSTNIANRYDHSTNQRGWSLQITSAGAPTLLWSDDGTTQLFATPGARLPAHNGQRLAVRVTLDVANADGVLEARFYTGLDAGATDDSAWRLLGEPLLASVPTSIHNPPIPVAFGARPTSTNPGVAGRLYRLQLRDGINGPVLLDVDTARASVGASSFQDAAGLTWTAHETTFSNRHVRLHGEVPDWTPERDKSGSLRTLAIAPAGITRRLSSGTKKLRSPLFRELSSPTRQNIVGYWSCEDSSAALRVASGLPNGPAGTVRGKVSMAANSAAWLASDALPTFAIGRLDFTVPAYTDTGECAFRFLLAAPAGGVTATVHLLRAYLTGTAHQVDIWITPGGDLRFAAFDDDGATLSDNTVAFDVNGRTVAVVLELSVSGGTVTIRCITNRFEPGLTVDDTVPGVSHTDTFAGTSIGRCTTLTLGSIVGDLGGTVMGHLAVANALAAYANSGNANIGWNGEKARDRLLRLAAEEGVPLSVAMDGLRQPRLGVQKSAAFLALLAEIERTDMGILFERRDAPELAYRSASSLTNQEPTLVLDFSAGLFDAIRPRDDDKAPFNVLTAKRIDGSEYTYELTEGPQSVQDPPDGIGRKTTSVDLSLSSDDVLPDHASWRVHVATVDEMRYPAITLNLAGDRVHQLIDAILRTDIGDKIRITNLDPDYSVDDVDLLVVGISDAANSNGWPVTFVCVPASPWETFVLGDRVRGRLHTKGSELAAPAGETDTELLIATDTGRQPWINSTDHAAMFPLAARLGGEVVEVTAITGSTSPQTFTVNRSLNGVTKSHAAGTRVQYARRAVGG
ncbi:hypothetical protein [Streptomyces sp. TRM68416]|uniref:hypothetical protein n=1 Tax=Streptomyces sp. TRM68416 TaxID=2758412 RepID=UPI0016618D2F|nr:hypothetical protein [Streptomyces sp. TRM68416]MBD0838778.1 hypothetical protein [Streptomyces sp. TRM68416]